MPVSRTLRWVVGIAFGLIAVSSVLRLLGEPDGWDVGFAIVQLVFYSLWLGSMFVLPPAIQLDHEGLRVRTFLRWGRVIAWTQVAEVQVQGRWQDTSSLALESGKLRRLIGMPVEDAQRLADTLATWHKETGTA